MVSIFLCDYTIWKERKRKMSKFTKQAIMDGFIELSKQMPIDKITVKKVTDYIGITRNTFYYHYQDIYALLEEIIVSKAKKLFVLDEDNLKDSWKSNLRFMGQYGKKNEDFIRNLYQSMGRDAFGDQLTEISYGSIYRSIEAYAEQQMLKDPSRKYTEKNIHDTAYILAKMLSENAVEWIRGRIEQDPVVLMEKAICAIDGVGEVILNNLSGYTL